MDCKVSGAVATGSGFESLRALEFQVGAQRTCLQVPGLVLGSESQPLPIKVIKTAMAALYSPLWCLI